MGSYNFTWSHPAEEVYVTGTFDNWGKTVKLDKKDQVHEKLVNLPSNEKVLYKFVADGNWSHDHTAKTETDHEGNVNNVLYTEDIQPTTSMAHSLSSVAPGATTTDLAGQQPLEKERDHDVVPGAFPETPAALTSDEKKDGLAGAGLAGGLIGAGGAATLAGSSGSKEPEQTFSVNPIPASSGSGNPISLTAGEPVPHSSTINSNTVASTVRDDPSLKSSADEQTVSVAPLPATSGIGNPISLAPGEKIPESSSYTANTIDSHVKLDKASYENSGASVPAVSNTSATERDTVAASALAGGLGPQTTNMIPESSLGMGADAPAPLEGAAINSVGANSTTNQLAGQVPIEPRGAVPEVVKESQKEAGVGPEASAYPEQVKEKKDLETELKDKIGKPEDQTSSAIGGAFGGALAGAGAAALGAAAVARQKTHETTGTDPVSVLPTSVQKTVDENTRPTGADTTRSAADAVPAEVKESQKEAHVAPEASANPEAVHEKSDVEKELLKKVPESQAAGEPAPTATAAATAVAPVASSSTTAPTTAAGGYAIQTGPDSTEGNATSGVTGASATEIAEPEQSATAGVTGASATKTAGVTEPSTTSATSANGAPQLADPTAGVAALSLDDKSKGLNAPASSQAQVAKPAELAPEKQQPLDSRDVSPMSKPNPAANSESQTALVVTTGVNSSAAPATSGATETKPVGTPRTGAVPSTPTKRNSIIDRLKGGKEGTPDSSKTDSSSTKKKGRLSRFFDKLKN
ncbi:Putative AMP-activated kinase, glycogen-binding protein [Septoria linicola]|uniref:AMP-activated kinase, glycogen-binding protein n=1 Tax=Septoria linicola TaxID=215465 RepID=A0A9Q9AQJ8_9PEZI|nr:putative AMP-activated kinase, glycogen-binding protein [Septoria linicola]USW53270.1 Putative AMP-activated kinase, glycogen-binding protein [Septoria linicola]